jgi:predicted dehydrogenase
MIQKENINWGILGCGWIAQQFADALNGTEGAVIYAAASRSQDKADKFAKKNKVEKAYGNYMALIEDPEVDIIYVATPHSHHFANTKVCLEKGKHVLCEKAFTVNTAQAKELLALAKAKNLFLMEALWTKMQPGMIKAKELIDSGVIGDIISMDADFGLKFEIDPKHRLFNPYLAGGVLLDIGIYPLFLSLYMFGKPSVIKAHSILDHNNIDHTTSMISQHDSGTMCNLTSTSVANRPVTASFYGTNGRLEFDNWWFTPVNFTLSVDEKEPELFEFPAIVNGYEYEIMEAGKCLRAGKLESDLMPHSFTLQLMEMMDEIRKQCRIVYPAELESLDEPFGLEEMI